ncbi:deoxyribonuclease TATDN1-like [Sycon ciliatum]|uniref:deoxyribonuclease TATDN1-like n=1 Tax=Sycon ciliatum TaxID=27933 RepID=UPI0031F6A96A
MAAASCPAVRSGYKFIDIGANLTDPVFRGVYRGKTAHADDFDAVLQRAFDVGVDKIMITGGSLEDSRAALELARSHERLYSTVGCHPTRCGEFDKASSPQQYLDDMRALIRDGGEKVVALGELGLDYDRLHFCGKETQLKYFELQFQLAEATGLPLFLHSRNAHEDFIGLMRRYHGRYKGGVVHSFTGDAKEIPEMLELGLHIGINGCSLKTAENVAAMQSIPKDRLMIETDAPWCEIRSTHAGHRHVKTSFPSKKKERFEAGSTVKSRNEPCHIINVLEVLAGERQEDASELADAMHHSTKAIFFPSA